MINVVIIDDERLAREELKSLLKGFKDITICDEAKNVDEAITKIKEHQPDVIFLDIQMPAKNGFDLLNEVENPPLTIFVTAFDNYAIEAFKVNALDYLLKPIIPERLEEAIQKVRDKMEEDDFTSAFSDDRKSRPLELNDRVYIKDGEKSYFPHVRDIRYIESKGNYVRIHFDQHKPMMLKSLNSLEERLNANHFFRANRKYIVNLEHVENIDQWFNGGLQITIKGGEKIEVSRRQAIKFKDIMSF